MGTNTLWTSDSTYTNGNALNFNGSNYAEGNGLGNIYNSDFSFEVWIDMQSFSSGDMVVYDAYDDSGSEYRIGIGSDKNNGDKFGAEILSDKGAVATGTDTFTGFSGLTQVVVAFDYSSNSADLYFDKDLRSYSGSDGNNSLNVGTGVTGVFTIGARNGGGKVCDEIVDMVQIHDKYLSQSEVNDLYQSHPST